MQGHTCAVSARDQGILHSGGRLQVISHCSSSLGICCGQKIRLPSRNKTQIEGHQAARLHTSIASKLLKLFLLLLFCFFFFRMILLQLVAVGAERCVLCASNNHRQDSGVWPHRWKSQSWGSAKLGIGSGHDNKMPPSPD